MSGLSRVATFAIGGRHALAIDDQGVVSSWGSASNGVLGNPAVSNGSLPGPVAGIAGPARFVSAGSSTSLAATGNDFYSWGSGFHGDARFSSRNTPTALSGYGFVVASAGRGNFTLALSGDGSVWAWGTTEEDSSAPATSARGSPEPVTGVPRAVAVSAGSQHSLSLSESGTVYAWGDNFFGQLGTGDRIGQRRPVAVALPGIAIAIAAGQFHSMALLADGRVYAWGINSEGAVGRGDFIDAGTGQSSGLERRVAPSVPAIVIRSRSRRGAVWPGPHDRCVGDARSPRAIVRC